MALDMEVGLGPGHIVLDGDPAPFSQKEDRAPNFWPISIVAKRLDASLGMEVDLSPGDFVLDGDPAPSLKRGGPPNFWPMSIVAKRPDESRCHLVRRQTSAQATLCQMGTQLPLIGARPQFSVYVYCGQTARWTKTPWYGSRPRPRPHCVRLGSSSPRERGKTCPCRLWPRSPISATAKLLSAMMNSLFFFSC